MQAADLDAKKESLIMDSLGLPYVPVAALYGPNGGGKSNLLEGIRVLRVFVMRPILAGKSRGGRSSMSEGRALVKPFAFSEAKLSAPTTFDVYFESSGIPFHYVIKIHGDKVLYEEFSYMYRESPRMLFVRRGGSITAQYFLRDLKIPAGFSSETPYLSYVFLMKKNTAVIRAAYEWFEHGIDIFDFSYDLTERLMGLTDREDLKPLILEYLRAMDMEIDDYLLEHDGSRVTNVDFIHCVNGKRVPLSIYDESAGTRKVFSMMMRLLLCLRNGSVLVFDELDAKLHPLLLQFVISLFTDKAINKSGAQLIFSSHDVVTLNHDVFREDEIWFAAKDAQMGTKLYSLADFCSSAHSQGSKSIGQLYIEGKYGADPYLRKIMDMKL